MANPSPKHLPDLTQLLYVRIVLHRIKASTTLAALVVVVLAAVSGLHDLAGSFPPSALWSPRASLEVAVGAAARLLGLAAGYWLLGSTAVYFTGRLMRFPAAVNAVDWATVPWVRRMAERITGRALMRALATPLPLLELVAPGYVPVPAPVVQPPVGPPVESIGSDHPQAVEVVVAPGDHMWGLAKAHLGDAIGRSPTNAEISPYWRRVVEANRDRIRSGDPDLIFPGEVLILPGL